MSQRFATRSKENRGVLDSRGNSVRQMCDMEQRRKRGRPHGSAPYRRADIPLCKEIDRPVAAGRPLGEAVRDVAPRAPGASPTAKEKRLTLRYREWRSERDTKEAAQAKQRRWLEAAMARFAEDQARFAELMVPLGASLDATANSEIRAKLSASLNAVNSEIQAKLSAIASDLETLNLDLIFPDGQLKS
jgi:hypothetical protein